MDFMKAMKQAQQMQAKMQQLEKEMAEAQFMGEAGGGLVTVTLTGKGEMVSIQVKDDALDDKETLEDLIVVAHKQAKSMADARMAESMNSVTGGMKIPGVNA
jgi:DNA-binding YbaB/EbfC family protein